MVESDTAQTGLELFSSISGSNGASVTSAGVVTFAHSASSAFSPANTAKSYKLSCNGGAKMSNFFAVTFSTSSTSSTSCSITPKDLLVEPGVKNSDYTVLASAMFDGLSGNCQMPSGCILEM